MKQKWVPNLNFPNLKRLAKEKPTKLTKALRLVWPLIRGALDDGETLRNIQSQVAEMGIMISYKLLQIYVSRLRREDWLKSRQVRLAAKSAAKESRAPVNRAARTSSKPIAVVIPGSRAPAWRDMTCLKCGRDILSCRCTSRNRPC